MVSSAHHPSPSSAYPPSHVEFLSRRDPPELAFPACSGHGSRCCVMSEWASGHLTSGPCSVSGAHCPRTFAPADLSAWILPALFAAVSAQLAPSFTAETPPPERPPRPPSVNQRPRVPRQPPRHCCFSSLTRQLACGLIWSRLSPPSACSGKPLLNV